MAETSTVPETDFTRWGRGLLWAAALGVAAVLYAMNLRFGELNQDEGWYLYAGRLVAEGQLPYVDFAHTQLPAMPFAYALAWPLVERWGVAGGRLFTALLGLSGALLAALAAWRLAPAGRRGTAALLAFVLVAVNAYHSYFTTIVKTYALCGCFTAAALVLLTVERGRLGRVAAYLAGVALALAAGTRLSAGAMAAAAVVGLWFARRQRPGDWLRVAVGGGVAGLLLMAPFLWLAPDNFIFGVLQYHAGRRADNLTTWLVFRAGFVSRFVQGYFVLAVALVAALIAAWLARRDTPAADPLPGRWLLRTAWAGVAGVTLLHLTASVPYEDYQTIAVPAAGAALAVALADLARPARLARWTVLVVLLASIGAAFASPVNQSWFVSGRDRIWWRLRAKPHLQVLHETAAQVRTLAGSSEWLLTQDTYLAVEAGLRVPRGMELGPFCYYPGLDKATALRRRVLNRDLMEGLLRGRAARVAAISGYGLAIASPGITELPADEQAALRAVLAEGYEPVQVVRPFGQGETALEILERRGR